MTAEMLAGFAAIVLSLVLTYVPGLNEKYAGLDSTRKSAIMLGLLALCAGGAIGLACAGLAADFGVGVTCDKLGVIDVIKVLFAALVANQATFLISPQPRKVVEAKAERG